MNAPPDWWRTFFAGPFVDFWLRVPMEEATRAEADFVVEALGIAPGAKLLDVPCGGGRHAFALASRGFDVTAVDISPDFLAVARKKADELRLPIVWNQREMRDLPWHAKFDGAYCLGNSFGYLPGDENAAFLRAVAATLKTGARFVLDTGYIAEVLFPSLQERAWYPDGGGYCLAARRYDPISGRLHVTYTLIGDGKPTTHAMSARLHTCREVVSLFEQAGFAAIETYASLAREPFKLGSSRLLIVGSKK